MKSLILIFLTFFFVSAVTIAQTNQTNTPDSIGFEKTSFNYGKIIQGSSGECEFKFVNKGKNPLILTKVHASCGCTTPDWPKNPLKPGETGTIKVKYNTQIIGHFTKTIMVYSNAANSTVVLQITGEVNAK